MTQKTLLSLAAQKYFRQNKRVMITIRKKHEFHHPPFFKWQVLLAGMIFSKSFGYALRGILLVGIAGENKRMMVEEMATKLSVPRYFMAKVMNRLVKHGVLNAAKGRSGGFSTNPNTLKTRLIDLVHITGESENADCCVLRFQKCNSANPCPLHDQMEDLVKQRDEFLARTTVGDLMKDNKLQLLRSISGGHGE